ncbi:phage major capsid protein [Fusobacterium ulcerans]|uniref:Predicted phage phi-C31 gp36 major capsid-like protein n=1 Tax=Fusobacterium ulcerans TaxID=861 RepID=A0AAX2J8W1_9FUSO|nr:phage major capsid protein [Fusobacterium ulcerans]AVQ28841.1 phage major capsid protein [Fusobacterium ulcerans]EFS26324.1 HK97 family phage major capsid protein [Fusobacterium ulcerans ATCC 49185]SQJ00991.1 Predicted phage phi-C31 gp36 major capsid-like protein [Fusobacterium ulcerans]
MKLSDTIKQQLKAAQGKATLLLNKNDATIEEINAANSEIDGLQAKLDLALKNEEIENSARTGKPLPVAATVENGINSQAYENAFYNVLRNKGSLEDRMIIQNALSSTTGADGGLLIPADQRTAIIELKRQYKSLRNLVSTESVTTLTGTRVIEQDAENTPFEEVAESGKIKDLANPKWIPIAYSIKKYGGILPIPNTLLQDNTANLQAYINKWFAKKEIATENSLIVALLNTLTKKAITGIDGIKDVLNEELDPAISERSVVVTNQTGFNWLDKLKDSDGNYLLEKDPTNPTKKMIAGRTVEVYPNKTLKNNTTKAPIIIGDLKEAVVLFDRQLMTLKSTDVGAGAFENDLTKVRGTLRLDIQKFDTDAVVFLEVDTASAPTA